MKANITATMLTPKVTELPIAIQNMASLCPCPRYKPHITAVTTANSKVKPTNSVAKPLFLAIIVYTEKKR